MASSSTVDNEDDLDDADRDLGAKENGGMGTVGRVVARDDDGIDTTSSSLSSGAAAAAVAEEDTEAKQPPAEEAIEEASSLSER